MAKTLNFMSKVTAGILGGPKFSIAAAIGLLIGSGYYVLGFGGVVLTLLTLESLSQVGMRIPVRRDRIQNPEQSQP